MLVLDSTFLEETLEKEHHVIGLYCVESDDMSFF